MVRAFVLCLLLLLPVASVTPATLGHDIMFEIEKRMTLALWIQETNQKLSLEKSIKIVDAVQYHSSERQIDPLLIFSIINAESGYRPNAHNSYGARGLMQVVPRWHPEKLKGKNPYNINVNIDVGVRILDDCLEKHNNNLIKALRCYSGGAGKRYQTRIANTHKNIAEHLRAFYILNGKVLDKTAYVFHKPRTTNENKDALAAFIQNRNI